MSYMYFLNFILYFLKVWTDVRAPEQPKILSLTCQSGNTLFVKWVRPSVFFRFFHNNFWLMKLKLYEILDFMKCWFQDCRRVLRVLPFSKTWRWRHRLGGASRWDRQQHHQPHGERPDKFLHSHYDQQQDHQPQFNSICFSPIWKLAKCLYVRASRHQLQMLKIQFFEIQWKPFQPHG